MGHPFFTRASNPPGPTTPGSVQPGKGRNNSRAPVARIKRCQRIWRELPPCSANSKPELGEAMTLVRARRLAPELRKRSNQCRACGVIDLKLRGLLCGAGEWSAC